MKNQIEKSEATASPRHKMHRFGFISLVLFLVLVAGSHGFAANFDVITTNDSGVGSLRQAILDANANPGSTITFAAALGTITPTTLLPSITAPVTIEGATGNTVSGGGNKRVFFVSTPNQADAVIVKNLIIANGSTTGSAGFNGAGGGGGGLGAGGGVFIDKGSVTLSGVQFTGNKVTGGKGGNGGATSGTPGGVGAPSPNGTPGGTAGAAGGGGGNGGAGGPGPVGGGGGGGGSPTIFGNGGAGGAGGFGAGGGGGGAASLSGARGAGGAGGVIGGNGGTGGVPACGWRRRRWRGCGRWGVFASPGATLTIVDTNADDSVLTGGAGGTGATTGVTGQTAGSAFFLPGPTTFMVTTGTQLIGGSIADAAVGGFQRADITKTGNGMLVFTAPNTYGGTTTVQTGILQLNNLTGSGTGTGNLVIQAGATLSGFGAVNPTGTNSVTINGTFAPGVGAPATFNIGNSLNLNTGATLSLQLGGKTPGDGSGFYSQVNMTNPAGSISLNGTVTLNLALVDPFTPGLTDVFYILTRSDSADFTTFFDGAPEGATVSLGSGITGTITYQANWLGTQAMSTITGGNDVAIFIPEPCAASLLAFGGVALVHMRRRRL